MIYRTASKFILLLTIIFSLSSGVHAGIGTVGGSIGNVGSPVIPSNLPPPSKESPASPNESTAAPKVQKADKDHAPLLVITFSQKRVNFERTLIQAIVTNEKNFPGSGYDVVSAVPSINATTQQGGRLSDMFNSNLNAVVEQMMSTGLTADRIHTSTESNEGLTSQEISIFSNQ